MLWYLLISTISQVSDVTHWDLISQLISIGFGCTPPPSFNWSHPFQNRCYVYLSAKLINTIFLHVKFYRTIILENFHRKEKRHGWSMMGSRSLTHSSVLILSRKRGILTSTTICPPHKRRWAGRFKN